MITTSKIAVALRTAWTRVWARGDRQFVPRLPRNHLTVLNAYRFSNGEDVPSFLLDYVPHSAVSKRPDSFIFSTSCDVFETADRFVVAPFGSGHSVILMEGGVNLELNAVSKDVHIPLNNTVIGAR